MNIFLAFNQREAHCCMFAFDNFHSLITLRIGMNYLSQSNSFLPLKAVVLFFITWSCYLLQASFWHSCYPSVNWFRSWSHQKTTEGKKKIMFVFFSLNEMNQFNQEFWQAQAAMGNSSDRHYPFPQQFSVTLRPHETVFSRLSTQYIVFYISQDQAPMTIQHTYVHNMDIFWNLHEFSYFSLPVYLWAA